MPIKFFSARAGSLYKRELLYNRCMDDYRLKDIEDTHRQLRDRIDELREEVFTLKQERAYSEHAESLKRQDRSLYVQYGVIIGVLVSAILAYIAL